MTLPPYTLPLLQSDYPELLKQITKLTDLLIDIEESFISDLSNIQDYHTELESKLFRFTLSCKSFVRLFEPTQFSLTKEKQMISAIDLNSTTAITRNLIETFMVMYYLWFRNISDDQKSFQHCIYQLHGIKKQMGYARNAKYNPVIANSEKDKLNSEMNIVIDRLISNKYFLSLTPKDKSSVLKAQSALSVKQSDLFREAGLFGGVFNLWSIYSNYVHSEFISDRQYNTFLIDKIKLRDFYKNQCWIVILLINIINSEFIENYDTCLEHFSQTEMEVKEIQIGWELIRSELFRET